MRAGRLSLIVIAAVLGVALAVSWIVPKVLIHMFNYRLLAVPGYRGRVERVNVEWLRPGLKVQRLHFDKQGRLLPPFFYRSMKSSSTFPGDSFSEAVSF